MASGAQFSQLYAPLPQPTPQPTARYVTLVAKYRSGSAPESPVFPLSQIIGNQGFPSNVCRCN